MTRVGFVAFAALEGNRTHRILLVCSFLAMDFLVLGVSKGFGFINFAEHDNARAAVEALNGKQLGADFRVCWREWDRVGD